MKLFNFKLIDEVLTFDCEKTIVTLGFFGCFYCIAR